MAKVTYLEFEKPVAQLEEKIQELRDMSSGSEGLDLTSDINGLEKKKAKLLKEIFNKLSPFGSPSESSVHTGLHQHDFYGLPRTAR